MGYYDCYPEDDIEQDYGIAGGNDSGKNNDEDELEEFDENIKFFQLASLDGRELWNNIVSMRGILLRRCQEALKDDVIDNVQNIANATLLLKAIQRFCTRNKSMRLSPDDSPLQPGISVGVFYRDILPIIKGTKKSLKKLSHLAKETRDIVLDALSNCISYIINNPNSLRSIYEFKQSTSQSVTADPRILTAVCLGLDTTGVLIPSRDILSPEHLNWTKGQKRVLKRVERVDMTMEEFVEKLKARPAEEMISGFGPGKDVKLPRSWVRDWIAEEMIEDDKEEIKKMSDRKNGGAKG